MTNFQYSAQLQLLAALGINIGEPFHVYTTRGSGVRIEGSELSALVKLYRGSRFSVKVQDSEITGAFTVDGRGILSATRD